MKGTIFSYVPLLAAVHNKRIILPKILSSYPLCQDKSIDFQNLYEKAFSRCFYVRSRNPQSSKTFFYQPFLVINVFDEMQKELKFYEDLNNVVVTPYEDFTTIIDLRLLDLSNFNRESKTWEGGFPDLPDFIKLLENHPHFDFPKEVENDFIFAEDSNSSISFPGDINNTFQFIVDKKDLKNLFEDSNQYRFYDGEVYCYFEDKLRNDGRSYDYLSMKVLVPFEDGAKTLELCSSLNPDCITQVKGYKFSLKFSYSVSQKEFTYSWNWDIFRQGPVGKKTIVLSPVKGRSFYSTLYRNFNGSIPISIFNSKRYLPTSPQEFLSMKTSIEDHLSEIPNLKIEHLSKVQLTYISDGPFRLTPDSAARNYTPINLGRFVSIKKPIIYSGEAWEVYFTINGENVLEDIFVYIATPEQYVSSLLNMGRKDLLKDFTPWSDIMFISSDWCERNGKYNYYKGIDLSTPTRRKLSLKKWILGPLFQRYFRSKGKLPLENAKIFSRAWDPNRNLKKKFTTYKNLLSSVKTSSEVS